jgi:hypothetical protein
MVAWDQVSRDDVLAALQEYDRLGPEQFFSQHGYGPSRARRRFAAGSRLAGPPISLTS